MTIANDLRPQYFKDFLDQQGSVNYLTSAIKHNKHSNGILITGAPGTGKSTAAFLYAKATLCENRLESEYEPCGKCDSCLTEVSKMNHSNITYYRITEASTFKEAVNDLITMTKAAPVLTHDNIRDDNYRRFIIIDEIQSATKQSISPFLDSLEFAAEHVTVILISMDLDSMDRTVKDAIESRCIELTFSSVAEKVIAHALTTHYKKLNKEAAKLIAYLSKGNVRQAWSLLEYFTTQLKIEKITPNIIADHKLNSLTNDICNQLIETIENKTWLDTEKLVSKYLNDSVSSVNYLLLKLLQNELNFKGVELVSAISFWLQSSYKIPLTAVLRPFQNHKLLLSNKITTPEISNRVIPTDLPIVPQSIIAPTTVQITGIAEQLERITGAPVVMVTENIDVPECLKINSWKMFLNYYADN